uniref:Uncharacterized protein n=1 Tax=Anguilla anguilla TaxID=7936 RepID=A0A0E9UCG2_ANGAN
MKAEQTVQCITSRGQRGFAFGESVKYCETRHCFCKPADK